MRRPSAVDLMLGLTIVIWAFNITVTRYVLTHGFRPLAYGSLRWLVWLSLAFAIVGPLFLTNLLWFTAIHRVGPSRATLFANIQPFVAAVFALLILSEHLHLLQGLGGVTILLGILLERRAHAEEP